MTNQLDFLNQPTAELELHGSEMVDAIRDVRSRGGFVSGVKVGPRNADYKLRIAWNVQTVAFEVKPQAPKQSLAEMQCELLNSQFNQRRKEPELI